MLQSRNAIVVLLLALASLGVYWVATAQEERVPWPPPPVKFVEGVSGSAVMSTTVPPPAVMPSTDSKGGAADKKTGPVRKWFAGMMPGSATDAAKTKTEKSGLQQVGFKTQDQDLPPPIPPMLTVPPAGQLKTEPAMPPPPNSATRPVPVMPPAASSDLPPIPMPTLPISVQPSEPKAPAVEPRIVLPPTPVVPPAMPLADPPHADPSKSVITDPVQQIPVSNKPPAFVLINPRRLADANLPVVSPLIAHASGAGAPPSWPEPVPPQPQQRPAVQTTVSKSTSPPEAGGAILGVQTPPLTVEKRGPAQARAGETLSYQIVVRNTGAVAAHQVRVEDELPADAKILRAEPMPVFQANRAVWVLNELPPSGACVLTLTMQLGPAGGLSHSTSVQVSGAASLTTSAAAPLATASALVVQVAAPAGLVVGRQGVFEVTYTNQGKQRIAGLVLYAQLSPGLRHPMGQSIEADVGELEPGASKTVKVETNAVGPGRQGLQVRVASPSGPDTSAQALVDVTAAQTGLGVQQAAATRLFLGRTSDLRIDVTNHSPKPMRHVAIASFLPECVEFVAASERGNYQPNGRTVNWLVDTLAPGQTQTLLVRVQGKTAGQLPHQIIARADGVPENKSSALLAVEGSADLGVSLSGDPALEIGKDAVYDVRIANPGSGPNTNVRVEVTFAAGLLPHNATGPSAFRISGQTVVFDALPMLFPQGQAVYRIWATGQSAGDRRVHVSVASDQVHTPASRETGTRVYRD